MVARAVIDKVSRLLTDSPRSAVSPSQKNALRMAALQTLMAFTRSPFGASRCTTAGRSARTRPSSLTGTLLG